MEIKIYRVFEFYTHVVWSSQLNDDMANRLDDRCFKCLDVAQGEDYLPYVYTKDVASDVAEDLANIEFDDMAKIVEAYPSSYHHAPNQEIGIGFGIDYNPFEMWPCWQYYKVVSLYETKFMLMSDDMVKRRHRLKKRRPWGFPEELWKQFKR